MSGFHCNAQGVDHKSLERKWSQFHCPEFSFKKKVTCIVSHNCITEMYIFFSVKNFLNTCMFMGVVMTNEEGFGLSVISKGNIIFSNGCVIITCNMYTTVVICKCSI